MTENTKPPTPPAPALTVETDVVILSLARLALAGPIAAPFLDFYALGSTSRGPRH
jgi:hypothetical protein